ncbi:MAG: hypothetical protein RL885_16595 [Planctomycetota bacterium]
MSTPVRVLLGTVVLLSLTAAGFWGLFERLGPALIERGDQRFEVGPLEAKWQRLRRRHATMPPTRERVALEQESRQVSEQLAELRALGVGDWLASWEAGWSEDPLAFPAEYARRKQDLIGSFREAAREAGATVPEAAILSEVVLPHYPWELESRAPDSAERRAVQERFVLMDRIVGAAMATGVFDLESVSFVRGSELEAPRGSALRLIPLRIEARAGLSRYEAFLRRLLRDRESGVAALIERQSLEPLTGRESRRDGEEMKLRFRLDLTVIGVP